MSSLNSLQTKEFEKKLYSSKIIEKSQVGLDSHSSSGRVGLGGGAGGRVLPKQ